MGKPRMLGAAAKPLPNTEMKKSLAPSIWSQRKDCQPPCKGCVDRRYGCQDRCRKPSYIRFRENVAARKQDEQSREREHYSDTMDYLRRRKFVMGGNGGGK